MVEADGHVGRKCPVIDELDEDEKETDKLRKELFEDFTMFLLNNILMSVQFFENYEREMTEVREKCLEESSLDGDNLKIFEADTLHKLVSKRMKFQKRTTETKKVQEFLHPLRTYVTYQNVELANNVSFHGGKRGFYHPYYRLTSQRCEDDEKEASGYVNIIDPLLTEDKSDGSTLGSGTLIHHPDTSDNEKEPKKKPIQSGVLLSKGDSFYTLEPKKRSMPYSLQNYRTYERITQIAEIPKSCFKELQMKSYAGNSNRRIGVIFVKDRTKKTQKILMSAAFKRHFSEVFASHLAGQFGFDKLKLDAATFHLDHVSIKKDHAIHHVIPVLESKEWPHAIAKELTNEEGKKRVIQWPTRAMKEVIQKLGCTLVPMGYHEATDENSDYTLEWKIEFPKAEKYLLAHTMHSHVRCYLFTLILHKTFIGTELTASQFGPRHMLNLLFLMIRKNFLGWPEYSQGETLIKYLKILEKTLQKKCLASFFIRNRNLYTNSSQKILHLSQTIITRILGNPIPYILKGLMNLKFKEDFYPQLDYLKLYNILTVKDLKEYLHPTEPKKVKGRRVIQPPPKLGRDEIEEEELFQEQNTPLHREEVLRLFINHFINVANQSRKYGDHDYSMLYLIRARQLTRILSEESATWGEIQDFNDRIRNGILHCNKTFNMARNSSEERIKANFTPGKSGDDEGLLTRL